MMARVEWSVDDYQEYMLRRAKSKAKYNNKKVSYDGYKFDSKKEFNRYVSLVDEQTRGYIKNLKVHPKFPLLDRIDWDGVTIPKKSYTADFSYETVGEIEYFVVEDVKSVATQKNSTYRLKRHIFLSKYQEQIPNLIFREIV